MHEDSQKLINLMFRPGETVCVSNNKYGYHSIPVENALKAEVTLVSPHPDVAIQKVPSDSLIFVALNPIKGFREDANCTAFRNFLIEMDLGPLNEQYAYITRLGMPFSAAVFSGGKSLHFLISLEEDLPSEKVYRIIAEWILSIVTASDQNCKNPSRSIRLPGAMRDNGNLQKMVEYRGAVKMSDMIAWLSKYPDLKPKEKEKRPISSEFNYDRIKPWVKDVLLNGLNPTKGRNKQWFAIACEFALAGYSEDDTLDILANFFSPDRDFKEREWKTAIASAFKYMYQRK